MQGAEPAALHRRMRLQVHSREGDRRQRGTKPVSARGRPIVFTVAAPGTLQPAAQPTPAPDSHRRSPAAVWAARSATAPWPCSAACNAGQVRQQWQLRTRAWLCCCSDCGHHMRCMQAGSAWPASNNRCAHLQLLDRGQCVHAVVGVVRVQQLVGQLRSVERRQVGGQCTLKGKRTLSRQQAGNSRQCQPPDLAQRVSRAGPVPVLACTSGTAF